ncbi:unnamed protein product [Ectocarpus sp. CCAP 1310/34]|nr:unnamed protein product [Ectocarpus sp. CCAP 1310/34]
MPSSPEIYSPSSAAPPVSSPADEFTDEGGQGGPETGEAESAGPGGQEVESESQEGLDEQLVEAGGQEVESETFPPATHVPSNRRTRHELASYNTAVNENVEVREGRTRAQTRAVNQQSVSGLMATLGPISASEIVEAPLMEQRASDAVELPKVLIQDVQSEPGSYQEARQSMYSTIWDKAMSAEFEGLLRTGTFALAVKAPIGCNVIDATWVYKWKADETGKIMKAKARFVAKGFKQKHGVDYLETFLPTANNAASIRLLSELDHEVFMKLPPGCESMTGKEVRFDKSLFGLRQASTTFHKRLVLGLKSIGFEQSLSDPCVLRFMMKDEVLGMIAIHVRDGGEDVQFREVVGSLMWIANQTRPDISNAVRAVARHSHEPKKSHWKAAQKILNYLLETTHLALKYKQDTLVAVGTLVYVDADFASKAPDRRSVREHH